MEVSFVFRCRVFHIIVGMTCLPACFAPAQEPATAARDAVSTERLQIADIALGEGGLVTGRVVDNRKKPKPQIAVTVFSAGQEVATTRTDDHGTFAVAGLRGGVHQFAIPEACITCRLWAAGTAPPAASSMLEIIEDPNIVRGQWGPPSVANNFLKKSKMMATNPFVVGGVVGAAVALPVALHNADEDDGPSS